MGKDVCYVWDYDYVGLLFCKRECVCVYLIPLIACLLYHLDLFVYDTLSKEYD